MKLHDTRSCPVRCLLPDKLGLSARMTAPYPGWRSRVCSCCSRRGTKGEGRPPPVAGPIMCAPQARPALFQARGRPFMPGPGEAARVLTAPPGHRSRLAGNANRCNRWRDKASMGLGRDAGMKKCTALCFCWGFGFVHPRFCRVRVIRLGAGVLSWGDTRPVECLPPFCGGGYPPLSATPTSPPQGGRLPAGVAAASRSCPRAAAAASRRLPGWPRKGACLVEVGGGLTEDGRFANGLGARCPVGRTAPRIDRPP